MTRNYYELQERDMESTENADLPVTFNEQFLWNRNFTLRWDFTKNLHMNFQSATHAQIEEPYTVINKDLYPDEYQAWKDSVKNSIRHFGTPLDYQQNFNSTVSAAAEPHPNLRLGHSQRQLHLGLHVGEGHRPRGRHLIGQHHHDEPQSEHQRNVQPGRSSTTTYRS